MTPCLPQTLRLRNGKMNGLFNKYRAPSEMFKAVVNFPINPKTMEPISSLLVNYQELCVAKWIKIIGNCFHWLLK